ncbi:MAG: hypothetical protein LHV68_13050 [Elusimicrobia bacterium]|nr:hypothetical protein [Candidatus Liberimonas magnetica]
MIERAIENWLTNTNERNYQIAFCQVLMNKGEKIIYVCSHGPAEQGKDIISIDKEGNSKAYQLKTGDINLAEWRKIRGEIQDLIELSIRHPSVDKTKMHKSVLVANGDITADVRAYIDQLNDDNVRMNRNFSPLSIVCKDTLLKEFIDAHGRFMPVELKDMQMFLEIYLHNGKDFFPKEKYINLVNNMLFSKTYKQKSDYFNIISSSVIITSYILKSFQEQNNYYAMFEAWVLLAGNILRYVKRNNIDKELYLETYDLIKEEVEKNIQLLEEEIIAKKVFLEGNPMGDGWWVYKARATIVLGTISAFEVKNIEKNKEYRVRQQFVDLVKENVSNKVVFYWGESAFPYFLNIINFLEAIQEKELALNLLIALFSDTLKMKEFEYKGFPMPNPYYTAEELLEALLGISFDQLGEETFVGSSYVLNSLIEMLARRNQRKILEENWKKVSYIHYDVFAPKKFEDIFLWRAEEGENHYEFPNMTQSWKDLYKEANNCENVDNFYREYSDLIRYALITYPHRINKYVVRSLDIVSCFGKKLHTNL